MKLSKSVCLLRIIMIDSLQEIARSNFGPLKLKHNDHAEHLMIVAATLRIRKNSPQGLKDQFNHNAIKKSILEQKHIWGRSI